MTNFVTELDRFIDAVKENGLNLHSAAVAVLEKTVRRRLKIKKPDPLVYRGMQLRCFGSKRWRNKQDDKRFEK